MSRTPVIITSAHRTPTTEPHEHAWTTASRHPTSMGIVVYVRCVGCGTHRVDLQQVEGLPPLALSAEVEHAGDHHSFPSPEETS